MLMEMQAKQSRKLTVIKLVHTLVWILMVGCILAIPVAALRGRFVAGLILSGVILAECLVLVFNRYHCPLTDVAGRYTDKREANFDIYLPLWLARYNKTIFGVLFVVGEMILCWRYLTAILHP